LIPILHKIIVFIVINGFFTNKSFIFNTKCGLSVNPILNAKHEFKHKQTVSVYELDKRTKTLKIINIIIDLIYNRLIDKQFSKKFENPNTTKDESETILVIKPHPVRQWVKVSQNGVCHTQDTTEPL